jgi:ABC-2 type transport system ATP-binding protein
MSATTDYVETNSGSTLKHTSEGVAISIRNLSKTYPIQFARIRALLRRPVKEPVQALHNVSFDVRVGEIFGLIGRNGAGKTTLTKIVATLVQPTVGTVNVLGHDSVKNDQQVRRKIGLAHAEERSFYWRLTARQNLMFFARLHGLSDKEANRRIQDLINKVELAEVANRRFGELSTGNKQRLAVARALLSQPPVLLLDEPTRSLDPLAAERMRSLISGLAHQDPPVSILFTSHNLAEVETLCARVAIITRGAIRAIDTPDNLRRQTSESESVTLIVRGIEETRIRTALRNLPSEFSITETEKGLEISFDRKTGDEVLDETIRALQNSEARIVDVLTERSTLLDLLERFETEESS